jgi:hypothetical protein
MKKKRTDDRSRFLGVSLPIGVWRVSKSGAGFESDPVSHFLFLRRKLLKSCQRVIGIVAAGMIASACAAPDNWHVVVTKEEALATATNCLKRSKFAGPPSSIKQYQDQWLFTWGDTKDGLFAEVDGYGGKLTACMIVVNAVARPLVSPPRQ